MAGEQNKVTIALAKVGMNKDTHPSQLNESQYTHAFNGNVETESGNSLNITNEKSNMLVTRFVPNRDFVVIGYENDTLSNHTYVFLVEPSTGIGEFGYIKDNQNVIDLQDIPMVCNDGCSEMWQLAQPLEEINQIELVPNAYQTLLNDEYALDGATNICYHYTDPQYSALNLGFNFDKEYPIKKIVIKNEKTGKNIYFTDNLNPPRHIDITNIGDYYIQNVPCANDLVTSCIDFDDLRIFKIFQIPKIVGSSIELGGNLKMGMYEFVLAYSDASGNEVSPYFSITQPIAVFDKNNKILSQPELADRTNYAIKLEVSNLDTRYTHYKVAVIQTADIEGAKRYFIEGLHTINDTTVLYTTENNKTETSEIKILTDQLHVERTEGLTSSNNILFQYGIEMKKEFNLQPIVNFLGNFFKWQTSIAKEDLYEDGVLGYQHKGYNREEVVPLGIRFLFDGGYESSVYPLISRVPFPKDPLLPNLPFDFEEVVDGGEAVDSENNDVKSILNNKVACGSSQRVYRWQYYNTATKDEGYCPASDDIQTETVTEEVVKVCELPIVDAIIPSGSITISLDTVYSNLADYIDKHFQDCLTDPSYLTSDNNINICNYLTDTYPDLVCNQNDLFDGLNVVDYNQPECTIKVDKINNEVTTTKPKDFPSEYSKMQAPKNCILYKVDYQNNGSPKQDPSLPLGYDQGSDDGNGNNLPVSVFLRDSDFQNEDCAYPRDIQLNTNPGQNNVEAFFNNYKISTSSSDLLSSKDAIPSGTIFKNKLHKNAIWFKGKTENYTEFIIDISKQKDPDGQDSVNIGGNTLVRLSLFKKCSDTTPIYSSIIDLSSGGMLYFKKQGSQLSILDSSGAPATILPTGSWITSGEYFIAIDTPIHQIQIDTDPSGGGFLPEIKYINSPTDGCYTVSKRYPENSRVEVTWSSIELKKVCTYTAVCEFEQPIAQSCKVFPFEKGKFAYWESSEKYPDNPELFDSTVLKINKSKLQGLVSNNLLSTEDLQEFEKIFTDGGATLNGNYIFKDESWNGSNKKVADFTCRNIRHFKFPDNNLAPFMYNKPQSRFGSTVIFPLGITIDERVINAFLDVAVDNGLITLTDRNKITGYEIFRGDINLDRSIVASGLLYDMRKYRESENVDKDILYSNFPYNTYSDDKFNKPYENGIETDITRKNLGENAEFGKSNRHYTFHSPETDYFKIGIPSEVSFQGYQFGNSRGHFDQVKEHPKWTILSDRAYSLADTLALAEVLAEVAIQAAQALSNAQVWFIAGFADGASIGVPAYIADAIIIGFGALTASVFKYGRYRYEWLKIFRDLGTPHNFAYYYFSEGFYNYMQNVGTDNSKRWKDEHNKLRAVNIGKHMNDGRFIFTNESTGEKLNVNNIDREHSVFLSFGKFPVEYPSTLNYTNFDKSSNDSSMTYLGENNLSSVGRSPEVVRNVASPYVALRNYLPSQYGTINSISWLTTSYKGDLKNPQPGCISIFGGDTFITRHTLKRKMSQFLVTAMKQADLTPYNYYFYNNIGRRPNFYVSYEQNKDFDGGGKMFPDIRSDFNFDNSSYSGNYYNPPSKFYLYHYGVPNFLTETRINTLYRYSGKERRESFYPLVGDLGEWTQEVNVPIREPNMFKYNNVYSNQVSKNRSRTIPDNYKKKIYDVIQNKPNGIIASLPDNTETSSFDPWLIYRPLDTFEFPTNYGKLKDIIDIESGAMLARFTDTSVLFNKTDLKMDTGTAITATTLGGNMFFQRTPVSFVNAELGYGGTQNFASISCEAGHFWVDAKRGQVLMVNSNGSGLEEISSTIGGKPSGMRNWFKEHLPFKILKTLPNVDTDNPYNGVGIAMGWDSRYKRVFITKKDYIPKPCVQFVPGQGFVYNETLCGQPATVTCPDGYTLNREGTECVIEYSTGNLCPNGYIYVYNAEHPNESYCQVSGDIPADCVCTANVSAQPQTICSGSSTNIVLTSTTPGTVFSWVVAQSSNITGAASGSGNVIHQTLSSSNTNSGTATYTITPYEPGTNGCAGQSITVVVTVRPQPHIVATPSSLSITSGDSISIGLTSDIPGTTFSWTTVEHHVTGSHSGTGNTIVDTLEAPSTNGSVDYVIVGTAPNGCTSKITVTVNVQLALLQCLNNFIIDAYTANPDCSGHGCNAATYKLLANGVDLGYAYLSNAGGASDQNNTLDPDPAYPVSPSSDTTRRLSRFVITPAQATAIAATTTTGDILLQLACDSGTAENNYGGIAGACHTSASHMRVYVGGNPVPIDCGCIAGNIVTVNVCTGLVTLPNNVTNGFPPGGEPDPIIG